jgi:4-hydroxy-2-oxoheptanedioate aldolase
MIPHLMSAKEAREIARTTRFRPTGLRPADGGNADGLYCRIPFTEYIEQANRERFIIVQIEDPEPLDELDEICSVEGIDIIFFGPGDFSHAIGVPGQIQHPEVEKARVRIAETARAHGKIAGTVGSVEGMARLVEMGYRFVNVGSDVQGLGAYYSRLTEGLGISASSGAAGYYGSGK